MIGADSNNCSRENTMHQANHGDNSKKNVYQKNGILIDTRAWDAEYDEWNMDRENNKKPGKHPDPDHPWNKKPEAYRGCDDDSDNEHY